MYQPNIGARVQTLLGRKDWGPQDGHIYVPGLRARFFSAVPGQHSLRVCDRPLVWQTPHAVSNTGTDAGDNSSTTYTSATDAATDCSSDTNTHATTHASATHTAPHGRSSAFAARQ